MANQSQARSTAAERSGRRQMAKEAARADEFQPSVLTHEMGGCDHPGTGRNQR
jgi:hypothetical protein